MSKYSYSNLVGIFVAGTVALITGCATQGTATDQADAAAIKEVTTAPVEDTSSPAIPVTAETVVPVESKAAAAAEVPKAGSVASVLGKMNKNPFTLYWREKDSYSYHIGARLDAEYKPGEGLVVKAQQEDNAIVCEFAEDGKLKNTNLKEGGKDQCSELMFTLDEELGE